MQEALALCHGLRIDWESNIWEIPGPGGKEVISHSREERKKGNNSIQHQQREGSKLGFSRAG